MKHISFIILLIFAFTHVNPYMLYAEEVVEQSSFEGEDEGFDSPETDADGLDGEVEDNDAETSQDGALSPEEMAAEEKETSMKECQNIFDVEGIPGNSVCKNVNTTEEAQMLKSFYDSCKAKDGGPGDVCRQNTGYGLTLNEDIQKGALSTSVFSDQIAFVGAEGSPVEIMGYHVDVFCSTVGAARCLELQSHYILKLMQGDLSGATALYQGEETSEKKYLQRQLDSSAKQEYFFEGKVGRTINFSKVCEDGDDVKEVLNDNFYIGTNSNGLLNAIDIGSNILYGCANDPDSCDPKKSSASTNYSEIYKSNMIKDGCSGKFLEQEGESYLLSDQAINDINWIESLGDADSIDMMLKNLEGKSDLTDEEKQFVFEQKMKKLQKTSIAKENTEGSFCEEAALMGARAPKVDGSVSDFCKGVYIRTLEQDRQDLLAEYTKENGGNYLNQDALYDMVDKAREKQEEELDEDQKAALKAIASHEAFQEVIVYEIRNNPELIASAALSGPDGPVELKTGVLEVLETGEKKFGVSAFRDEFVAPSDLVVTKGDFLANVSQTESLSFSGGFGSSNKAKGFSGASSFSGGTSSSSGGPVVNTPLTKLADVSFVPRSDNSEGIYSSHEDILDKMSEYANMDPKQKAQSNTRLSNEAPFGDYFNELSIDFGGQAPKLVGWQRMEQAIENNGIDEKDKKDCHTFPLTAGADSLDDQTDSEFSDNCQDAMDNLPEINFTM
ncbi:hypothetical protein MJH12_20365 [bacterium]|nr:hypothetical protein [bacterium]